MRKIAVTGGLSCGKTTVCQLFQELGAQVVSADEIVHRVLSLDTKIGKEIIGLLGPQIIQSQKQLDRQKIAEFVFDNPELLKRLEGILHPAVRKEIEAHFHSLKKGPLFVAEVPLLYESGFDDFFDQVIVVTVAKEVALQRFRGDKTSFEKRMERQWDLKKKEEKADFVIDNSGSKEQLQQQVKALYEALLHS